MRKYLENLRNLPGLLIMIENGRDANMPFPEKRAREVPEGENKKPGERTMGNA